jgi:hypothetical protein
MYKKKLEVAQMRFQSPLLGLIRLDKQTNTSIRDKLQVPYIVDIQYQRTWKTYVARTVEDGLSSVKRADAVIWGNQTKDGKTKSILKIIRNRPKP